MLHCALEENYHNERGAAEKHLSLLRKTEHIVEKQKILKAERKPVE